MKRLPVSVRVYILMTTALAVAFLAWQWYRQPLRLDTGERLAAFVAGVLLVTISSARPIQLPRSAHMALGTVFGFAAICLFDPTFGSLLFLCGLALGYAYKQWQRRTLAWFQILFNVAVQTFSVGVGGEVYLLLHRVDVNPVISWQNGLAFILGGSLFVLLNGALVAGVIGLSEGVRPWEVFMLNWFGSLIQFVSHVPLGGIIVILYQSRPWAVLLILLPLIAIHFSLSNAWLLTDAARNTLRLLATLVDARDPFTARHSRQVVQYAEVIAQALRIPLPLQEHIAWAAAIHDLGKVTIPEALLVKVGSLTREEWECIRTHPGIGAQLIEGLPLFHGAREIIHYHHEWFDGSGYPEGKAGEAIPLGARVLAVADALDAMTTDRPYRRPATLDQALAELRRYAGTQFDPQVVEAVLAAGPQVEAIYYNTHGEPTEEEAEVTPPARELQVEPKIDPGLSKTGAVTH